MTIATYGALKTAVQSYYNGRSDFPTTVYDLATAELNARLDLRIMQTETDLSLTGGTQNVALPSDFLRPIHAYIDSGGVRYVLDQADEFNSNVGYRSSGMPGQYVIISGNLLTNPVPDDDYTLTLRYTAKLDDFSADADTNAVLTTHPALYLYGSLKHVATWAQDAEALAFYTGQFEGEIRRAQEQNDRAQFGMGPLRVRAAHAP